METPWLALRRVQTMARSMVSLPPVDQVIPDLKRLFETAGVDCLLVGGLAVVHHGYVRTTEDIDVLLSAASIAQLEPHLVSHGFTQVRPYRLEHTASGVTIDLLPAGEPMPRGHDIYPNLGDVSSSPTDAFVSECYLLTRQVICFCCATSPGLNAKLGQSRYFRRFDFSSA